MIMSNKVPRITPGETAGELEQVSAVCKHPSSDFLGDAAQLACISSKNQAFYGTEPAKPYIIVFTINPVDQVPIWIGSISQWFSQYDIDIVYRHPCQALSLAFFQQSLGTLLWNGTLPIFTALKQFLKGHDVQFSYVECGFFPQTQHLYFDRMGINVDSSLAQAQLTGLPQDISPILQHKRAQFFQDVASYSEQQDYIFVPLQLANDSNIQLHSRFVHGMQAFIDYIEACYPNDTIVFKKHPRDTGHYQSRSAQSFWSTACSRALIKGAKKVHGINSTVLFEAELYGVATVIEGDCLLTRHAQQKHALLCAIILWQFDVSQADYSLQKIAERSYLRLDSYR